MPKSARLSKETLSMSAILQEDQGGYLELSQLLEVANPTMSHCWMIELFVDMWIISVNELIQQPPNPLTFGYQVYPNQMHPKLLLPTMLQFVVQVVYVFHQIGLTLVQTKGEGM